MQVLATTILSVHNSALGKKYNICSDFKHGGDLNTFIIGAQFNSYWYFNIITYRFKI